MIAQMTEERPAWYKFARIELQHAYDWVVKIDPVLAAWWDGHTVHVHSLFLWGMSKEADIRVEFVNKNFQKRSLSFKLTEIEHAGELQNEKV